MRYWLNTANGEWGIVRGSERNDLAFSGAVGTLVVGEGGRPETTDLEDRDSGLLVLEKAAFLKLYESLERLSLTPVYSPVYPVGRN